MVKLLVPARWLNACGMGNEDKIYDIISVQTKLGWSIVTVDRVHSTWVVIAELHGAKFIQEHDDHDSHVMKFRKHHCSASPLPWVDEVKQAKPKRKHLAKTMRKAKPIALEFYHTPERSDCVVETKTTVKATNFNASSYKPNGAQHAIPTAGTRLLRYIPGERGTAMALHSHSGSRAIHFNQVRALDEHIRILERDRVIALNSSRPDRVAKLDDLIGRAVLNRGVHYARQRAAALVADAKENSTTVEPAAS